MSFTSHSYIIDNIYVGNIFSTNNTELLSKINCIVSLVDNVIKHPNIDYFSVPIEDIPEADIIPICEKVYEYIENNKGKSILIHCQAGGSRSVATIMYYIINKFSKNLTKLFNDEAYKFFNTQHSNMNLNKGFTSQLKQISN